MDHINVFLKVLETGSPKSRCWQIWCLVSTASWFIDELLLWQNKRAPSGLFNKALIPQMKLPFPAPPGFPKVPPPNAHWGLGFQHAFWRDTVIQPMPAHDTSSPQKMEPLQRNCLTNRVVSATQSCGQMQEARARWVCQTKEVPGSIGFLLTQLQSLDFNQWWADNVSRLQSWIITQISQCATG
jgi:hypothetical protein